MALSLLSDIAIIFALSTAVNYLFTRIKMPTIIGYLLTGIVTGPFALGVIHAHESIELMAEIGVVLLMFTIGLEFSIGHLMKIRRVVFLGGFIQLVLTAGITMTSIYFYMVDWRSALFVGFLIALSSTAVVLKLMQERSEITANYGRTVVGILIFQDIILIPLLLFTPMLAGQSANPSQELILLLGKTIVLVAVVFVGNRWLIPRVLKKVAMTKNQELFMMTILVCCLSVALLTQQMGISLAFGAFLAGLMISDSDYSHNAFSDLMPFKDVFTSFFFVSIGMLFDVSYVFHHPFTVLGLVLAVVLLKAVVAGVTAVALGHTFRGAVMVALALCQVGEFSFILAKSGMRFNIITEEHYQLFLAVAIISMSLTPMFMMGASRVANVLLKLPLPHWLVVGLFPLPELTVPELNKHLVLIGKDARARSVGMMANHWDMPFVSIVMDPIIADELQKKGEMAVYGDAVNEPVLEKAHVASADIVVVSVGNRIAAMRIIEAVRHLNRHAEIIVRTKSVFDIEELYKLGANEVIPEEFETAIAVFEQVMKKRLIPQRKINNFLTKIRGYHYGLMMKENRSEESIKLFNELPNLDIIAIKVKEDALVIDKSLMELNLRKNYGITLIAILRAGTLIEHPSADFTFKCEDLVYIMGNCDTIADSMQLFGE
ncbi:MAG: monovalent cation:proton antiporter-2 (CPA2) family protein [Mangrovibacterium sp.]